MSLPAAEKIGKLVAILDLIHMSLNAAERTSFEDTRRVEMDRIHDLLAEAKEVADIPTDYR